MDNKEKDLNNWCVIDLRSDNSVKINCSYNRNISIKFSFARARAMSCAKDNLPKFISMIWREGSVHYLCFLVIFY